MTLQDKKIMPPPWLTYREIERYSIGWRMGYGEDYIVRFGDWLTLLSPEERAEYRALFPEPVTWKGWWDNEEIRKEILACSDPKQIKALGRKVRGFDQKVWDKFKYAIVLLGNWCKFSQNRNLREFLLSTGNSVLVEASPYDNIWGIRLAASSPEAQNPMKWRGQNLLGFALMEVRDELRRVTQNEMLCDWSTVGEQ